MGLAVGDPVEDAAKVLAGQGPVKRPGDLAAVLAERQPRVPGFAAAPPAVGPAPQPNANPEPPRADRASATRQLNVRARVDLHDRCRQLLRDCENAGLDTSMTELVHALLHSGPSDPGGVRDLLRVRRRALHEEL